MFFLHAHIHLYIYIYIYHDHQVNLTLFHHTSHRADIDKSLLIGQHCICKKCLIIYVVYVFHCCCGILSLSSVIYTDPLAQGLKCSRIVRETGVQSQVESFQMVLDASLLYTQHHKVWIKGKRRNPGKGVAPFLTPRCSNYWKGSLQFALDYGRPTYLQLIYIYIYIYISKCRKLKNKKRTKGDIFNNRLSWPNLLEEWVRSLLHAVLLWSLTKLSLVNKYLSDHCTVKINKLASQTNSLLILILTAYSYVRLP